MGEISVKTGNNARNGGKNSLNRLIRCVCGKKIGPDPRNFNQRVSLGRNDLLIRTFLSSGGLFNAVAKEVYRYDTRSSFQCNDKYWIIPELGREARYLMDTPNNYRAIYIENNSVHVTAVVCKKDGGYTRYPIESAEDILKNPASKGA
ncbi:hypothetical protein AAHV95_14915 [Klebsiella pneumoniae]